MQQISICFCLCPFYVKKNPQKNIKQNPKLIRFSKAQQEQTDTLT